MNRIDAMPFRLMPDKGHTLGVCVLLLASSAGGAAAALAMDSPVPLYSQEDALRLAVDPVSHMVDEATCELIAGVRYRDEDGLWRPAPDHYSALFRQGNSREPFIRIKTREDGVYVVRFPASQGEVIHGRAYVIDPETGREHYGKGKKVACVSAGKVEVGDLLKVADSEDRAQATQDGQP